MPRPVRYTWPDFDGRTRACTFIIPAADLAASVAEFGVDPRELEPQSCPESELAVRRRAAAARLRAGGFRVTGDEVRVDVATLWRTNLHRLQPARAALQAACGADLFPRAALAFVQQLPYRVPPRERQGKHIGELWPPLECLAEGAGDCDTKALLYACLVDDGTGPEVLLLQGPSHMLAAVEGDGDPGDLTLSGWGKRFEVCECSSGVWLPGRVAPEVAADLRAGRYHPVRLREG